MNQNLISKSFDAKATRFFEALQTGRESLERAGQLLVELLDEEANAFEILIQKSGGFLKADWLETLERVGRKQLRTELLLSDAPGSRRVMQMGLTYTQQGMLLDKPFNVVTKISPEGQPIIVTKRLNELSQAEAGLSIGPSGVRKAPEQVEILLERAEKMKGEKPRYTIHNGKVTFHVDATFSAVELEQILRSLMPAGGLDLQKMMRNNQIVSRKQQAQPDLERTS